MTTTSEELSRLLNKLCKWRTFFASWQLGTRVPADGELRAVKNHRETTILLRAEVSALTGLLIEKGVITGQEFQDVLAKEARQLDHDFAAQYSGWSSSDDGMILKMPEAMETTKSLGFPP
jgi:hypothetical protein